MLRVMAEGLYAMITWAGADFSNFLASLAGELARR
jgi:hypothetical protein